MPRNPHQHWLCGQLIPNKPDTTGQLNGLKKFLAFGFDHSRIDTSLSEALVSGTRLMLIVPGERKRVIGGHPPDVKFTPGLFVLDAHRCIMWCAPLCAPWEILMVTTTARKLFRRLGPGLITGAADDHPSGIATYS